jgi:type IV pilus assembly protein PilM
MATKTGRVWALDLGNDSLKALQLSTERGVVEVTNFDNIPHGKILNGSGIKDAEKQELIALSLRKFVSKHDISRDEIAVSVPSQNSFARFVNLPPVDRKRIAEIVKFEAVQQIPFDINEVQWDWQMMTEADSSELKVGIFAIKNEVVNSMIEYFSRENLQINYVQMAPMTLYNYIVYDRPDLLTSDNQAIVILNIGAENTDLVVCTKSTVWQRCVLLGGNSFTKAVADAFKLNFEKAEKLKRTAPVSKYARQVFQAMKPVFTDLATEIQRSLGFYSTSNPNTKLVKIIALGGGTKLRGLLKYLQQTLQIPVELPDAFKRLEINPSVSPAKFHENVCDFGVVYGLALQGLGLSKIESNLLPRSIARSAAWVSKSKSFIAAAAIVLAVSLLGIGRTLFDQISYTKNDSIRRQTSSFLSDVTDARNKLDEVTGKLPALEAIIQKEFEPFKYRNVIPLLHQTILSTLPNEKNNPAQRNLYQAFATGDVGTILKVPRNERKQIFITSITTSFTSDLDISGFGAMNLATRSMGAGPKRGGRSETDYEMMREMERRGYRAGAGAPQYYPPSGMPGQEGVGAAEPNAGFVVIIAGYSPYKNIGELMDPSGVENALDKWGLVTRLMHLDELVDGNSPFKLYKKAEVEHFNLQIGEVGLDAEIPPGIGVLEVKADVITGAGRRQPVTTGTEMTSLIDPMTKEVISKVAELDEFGKPKLDQRSGKPVYKVNDHWFILNAKFRWKDAPKVAVAQPVVVEQAVPYTPPPTTTPTKTPDDESSSRRKRTRATDLDL